jgi:hypothetical protein
MRSSAESPWTGSFSSSLDPAPDLEDAAGQSPGFTSLRQRYHRRRENSSIRNGGSSLIPPEPVASKPLPSYVPSMSMIPPPEGRPLLWRTSKGMVILMLLPAVGMGITGFLVPAGSRTEDGFPLNCAFWAWAGFWMVTNVIMMVIFSRINSGRIDLLEHGLHGTAKVLSTKRTGTLMNDNPAMAIRFEVNDGFRGLYETVHKEAMPVEELDHLKAGSEIGIRASRTKKGKLLLLQ